MPFRSDLPSPAACRAPRVEVPQRLKAWKTKAIRGRDKPRPRLVQSKRFAAQELRHFADETRCLANECALESGHAVDKAEADIADEPQQIGPVREQPVQSVGGNSHGHGIETAPALIPL